MSIFLLSSLILCCSAGVVIISYEHLALQRKWPVGRFFKNTSFQLIFGLFPMLGTTIYAIIAFSFLWAVVILIISWIIAFLISFLLKSWVQMTAIVFLIVSWFLQFFIK